MKTARLCGNRPARVSRATPAVSVSAVSLFSVCLREMRRRGFGHEGSDLLEIIEFGVISKTL